jgi:hypothetical protein
MATLRSNRRRLRRGQSTTEYMMYLSVIVIALVSAAWLGFGSGFQDGFGELRQDVQTVLKSTQQSSSNDRR